MGMFCFQCQEAAGNKGCSVKGVCGKDETVSNLQDLLIYVLQGLAAVVERSGSGLDRKHGVFACRSLFSTITNANFDGERISELIEEGLRLRDELKQEAGEKETAGLPESAIWSPGGRDELEKKAAETGVMSFSGNPDVRSLKSIILYGLKGIAAYTDHAAVLDHYDPEIFEFMFEALDAIGEEEDEEKLTGMVLKTGEIAVKAMALLDRANTETYGNPEITSVNIGTGNNPGILISGHDLRDMEDLLKQTEGTGVDVYTHCEMLPANYYPAFSKFSHLAGNYGGSWWKQGKEFESFNGPILMTTNCIVPVRDSYRDRIFTTGMAGYPGVKHIPARKNGEPKDFSDVIELALKCDPPAQIEEGEITGGFAHNQVLELAGKIVEAVKSGAIKRFVVMAGCDGRQSSREYYSGVAEKLPPDTVILTAGCAKYRYNKLRLGDIGGIPRVLDAGQCNDSYSLAVTALNLKEIFEVDDINDLPISFDIAWYEQKAVAVLLGLLHLGFKDIRLGPTLPAFLSGNVQELLVEKFGLKPSGEVEGDVEAMMEGR